MRHGFEIDDEVERIPTGRKGSVVAIIDKPAPMIAIRWNDDGTEQKLPPEFLRYSRVIDTPKEIVVPAKEPIGHPKRLSRSPYAIVSLEEIEAHRTPSGGWTRKQLAKWGVRWPPKKGWKYRLAAGENPNVLQPSRKTSKPSIHRENLSVRKDTLPAWRYIPFIVRDRIKSKKDAAS